MRRAGPFQWLLRLLAVVGFLTLIVIFTPLVPWIARTLAGSWNDTQGDTLIVPGGSEMADNFPGPNTVLRSMYAVRAYRSGHFRRIVLLGKSVGRDMQLLLLSEGVPAAVIETENASTSTRENAIQCSRLLNNTPGNNVLLTSDFHMFRAVRVFRKAGVRVSPRPIPDILKRSVAFRGRTDCFLDELTEFAKIGYYFVRGWM